MTTKYDIEQVVYVVSNKKQQVFPVQIAEKIHKSTIDGDETSYKVKIPIEKYTDQLFELDEIDGEIYTSLDGIRVVLKERVNNQIDLLIDGAGKVAEDAFGVTNTPQDTSQNVSDDLAILKAKSKPKPKEKKAPTKRKQQQQPVQPKSQPQVAQAPVQPTNNQPLPENVMTDENGNPKFKIGKITGFEEIEERKRRAVIR